MPTTTPTHFEARPSLAGSDRRQRRLLRAVDAGLAACVFGVPWLLGGRHPLGQLVLVVLAVGVAMAWTAGRCLRPQSTWRRSAGVPVLAAAVALVGLQVLPLPEGVLAWLSPTIPRILPLWSAGGEDSVGLGAWSCISLSPAATRAGLALLVAYGLLFWVCVQRIREVEDVERLLRWCGLSALAMAALGLLQFLAGNGKFLWFYEDPFRDTLDAAKGAFTNRNHFAHFLALGVGPFIWWAIDSPRKKHRRQAGPQDDPDETLAAPGRDTDFRWLGLGAILLAGLLSLSRGGMVVLFLAAGVVVAVCYREKRLGPQALLGLGGAAVLVGVALAILGHAEVADRMDDLAAGLASGSVDSLDAGGRRRTIWSAVASAARDFPVLGSGVGSHRWVYPMYLDAAQSPDFEPSAGRIYFTHAENGPLQIALETGLGGVGLLMGGTGLVGYWCWTALRRGTSRRARLAAGAASAALLASLVHSLVDFVWYVPACTALVAILAACACRLSQLASEGARQTVFERQRPRRVALAAAGAIGLAGVWMALDRLGPALGASAWQEYQLLARLPAEGGDGESDATATALARRIAVLENALRHNPSHAEAHLRLAGEALRLFERLQATSAPNAMPLSAVRDAAVASQFTSRGELDAWLARSVGPHAAMLDEALAHARRGLAGCPLEGVGYLYLAEVSFLEGPGRAATTRACVEQALRVRPFDGTVLIAAGNEAIRRGDARRGIALWQQAYGRGTAYRLELVRRLAGRVCPDDPASDVAFFLDTFQPDLAILRRLESAYVPGTPPEQLGRLWARRAEAARAEAAEREGLDAAKLWLEARLAHVRLGDAAGAVECLRRAAGCDPNDYTTRHRLAASLAELDRHDEALAQVAWCLARRPDDASLRGLARRITRAQASRAAAGPAEAGSTRYRR